MKNKFLMIIPAILLIVAAVIVVLVKNNLTDVTDLFPEQTAGSSSVTEKAEITNKEAGAETAARQTEVQTAETGIKENGVYDSKDDVALYIHTYGKLPSNYIKKAEAEALGWPGGELEKYAPGKCIGGDTFGNREGLLPKASGRTYTECDIDTLGAKSRGAKRIVFSNDGLIFYTEDHYESFTQLY